MQRLPWVERKFQLGIPEGWLPNILTRLRATTISLNHYASQLSEQAAEFKPDGKWSIKEHIGHLADLEDLHLGRIDDFEQKKSVLRAADMSNKATEKADHNARSIAELLSAFQTKRTKLLHRLETLDDATQFFISLHPRLNVPMKPVDMAFFTAEHDDHHVTTIREFLNQS